MITLTINGAALEVPEGVTVAAAVIRAGVSGFSPLCGMGICFGCQVTLNGSRYQRSCQTPCEADMEVRTDEGA